MTSHVVITTKSAVGVHIVNAKGLALTGKLINEIVYVPEADMRNGQFNQTQRRMIERVAAEQH